MLAVLLDVRNLLYILSLHQDFLESLDVILFRLFGKSFVRLRLKSAYINCKSRASSYLPSDVSLEIILVADIGLKVPEATRLIGRGHGEIRVQKDCMD
jgi:hypothetical protein